MIKEIPMLYSTPMVVAISEDRKTKTRRTKGLEQFNENPDCWRNFKNRGDGLWSCQNIVSSVWDYEFKCPYGKVGDVIYVRETWGEHVGKNEPIDTIVYKADNFCKDFIRETCTVNNVIILREWYNESLAAKTTWKSPLHLKKIHARHWLKITDIKVERLQDISEEDAIAEGVEPIDDGYKNYYKKLDTISKHFLWPTAYHSFQSLWESINGSDNWDVNPLVWVISFKRVERP